MNLQRGSHHSDDSKKDLAQSLERKARRIVRHLRIEQWHPSPESSIEREIALVLGKIDNTRTLHKNLQHSMIDSECSIGTDLMNLTPHDPDYTCYHADPRQKLLNRKLHERLKTRMERIKEERRSLAQTKTEKLDALRSELLELLERWELVRG